MSKAIEIPDADLLESLGYLQAGAAAIAKAAKKGKTAEQIERGRVNRMLAEHVQMLHEYSKAAKGNFERLMSIGDVPAAFLSAISAGPAMAAQIHADAKSKEKPAKAARKSRTRSTPAKPPCKPAARTRRTPASKPALPGIRAGQPVTVAAKPLGSVIQVVVQRGGNTYLHTFKSPPDLMAADAQGVLVIRGRFKLNPQGFIVG